MQGRILPVPSKAARRKPKERRFARRYQQHQGFKSRLALQLLRRHQQSRLLIGNRVADEHVTAYLIPWRLPPTATLACTTRRRIFSSIAHSSEIGQLDVTLLAFFLLGLDLDQLPLRATFHSNTVSEWLKLKKQSQIDFTEA